MKTKYIFRIFLSSFVFFVASFSYAFAKTHITHVYSPETGITRADRLYVETLTKFPGVTVTEFGSRGLTRAQQVSAIRSSIVSYPDDINLVEFSGHGTPGGYGTNSGYTMYDQVRQATEAAQAAGTQVLTIVDCCGSGNLSSFSKNPSDIFGDGLNNLAAITSSAPGQSSWVGAGKSVAERLAYYRNLVDQQHNLVADINKDGILTVGELMDAMKKDGLGNQFIIPPGNEGAPVFAATPEALAEYNKKWLGLCVVVKPGQDKEFGKMYGTPGVGAYDGEHLDINGKKATDDIEDKLNFDLRKANFGCLSTSPVNGTTDKGQMPGCNLNATDGSNYDIVEKAAGSEKNVSWVSGGKYKSLSRSQAESALKDKVHAYTVPDSKQMQPSVYTKGSTAKDAEGKPVFVVRQDCKFITPPIPSPIPSAQPNSSNPGSNTPNNGQGDNGQQPNNGQNGQPTPYPSPTPTPTPNPSASPTPIYTSCPADYVPVCDEKLQTQPNECIAAQNGVKILHKGACTDETGTITDISAAISKLITESLASGVPENVIANTIKNIITLVKSVYEGSSSLVTSVIQ